MKYRLKEKNLNKMIYISGGNIPSRGANILQSMKMAYAFSKLIKDFKLLINVSIFSFFKEFNLCDFYNIGKIKLSKMPCSINKDMFFPRFYKSKFFMIFSSIYAKFNNPDVVYTRNLDIAKNCLRLGLKVVLEYHNQLPIDYFCSERFKAANFLGCITISQQLRNFYISNGLSPEKIIVEQDGVNLSDYEIENDKSNTRKNLNLPIDKYIITYCGHLYDFKGIPMILKTAKKFKNDIFLLIGGWEQDIKRVKLECKRRRINNVICYGYVKPKIIPKLLYVSDLLLLPTSAKHKWAKYTSPLKLFEYMASGRPIVASKLDNISCVLKNEKNALLFEPDSLKDFKDKILFAKKNKEKVEKLASQARLDVKYYDWNKRARRIIEFIENRMLDVKSYLTKSIVIMKPQYKYRIHHGWKGKEIGGPSVKLARMVKYFPNFNKNMNIIYTVSGSVPFSECLKAKKKGIPIIQHINSVYHPAYRKNFEKMNEEIRKIFNIADYYVFGSEYAKEGARRYLGEINKPFSIIFNAVDLNHFAPVKGPDKRCNILVIGRHYIRHRIEPVIRAMPYINKLIPQARLVIAGELISGEGVFNCSKDSMLDIAKEVGVNNVEYLGSYSQNEAPSLYNMGDILVHTKHMDWTPNTVIEGMACGLPIVYSGNGGTRELLGKVGVSLELPFDWDNIHEPSPDQLARAVVKAFKNKNKLGKPARQIAIKNFSIETWVSKHKEIFDKFIDFKMFNKLDKE